MIGEWLPGKFKNICGPEVCSLFDVVYNILIQIKCVQSPGNSST